MKKLLSHHFTRAELAIEEIAILAICCAVLTLASRAAEVDMPIRVNLVRCVTHQEQIRMCDERNLCCDLIGRKVDSGQERPEPTLQNHKSYENRDEIQE